MSSRDSAPQISGIPGAEPPQGGITTSLPWTVGFLAAGVAVIALGILITVDVVTTSLVDGKKVLVFGVFGAGLTLIDVAVTPLAIRQSLRTAVETDPSYRATPENARFVRLVLTFATALLAIPSAIAIVAAFVIG